MVRSRTKLLDRVLAVTLAVIMLFAMIPMSTLTAFALSYEAGSDCTEDSCTGKMQWVLNSENDAHHLVCDNEECVRNALIEAFVIHSEGEGGDDCLLCNPLHAHGSFTYSVENEGKTLVATCGSAGTCDLVDKKVSITIAAPANLEYDGTVKAATISGAEDWKTATGNEAPTISYSAEPKTVGTYTASITVDETTASVEFAIVKGNPVFTVPTNLTAKYGQTLTDVVLPAGFTWDVQTASVGEIGVNTFKATFTPTDTDNYNIVTDIDINVTVGKATSVIAAPSISGEATQTTITLDAITPTVGDGNVEYGYVADEAKKDDPSNVTNWQAGTTFTGLEGSKTYYFYARVSETTNYTAAVSAVSSISTKNKLNGELTISIDSWTYGDTAVDPDFEIVIGDYGLAKVEYLNLDEEGALYSETVPTKAGHYRVRVSCDATAIYAEAAEYCDFEIKQKEVTIEWSNTSVVYNAQNQKPVATITAGIVGSDDLTVVVSGEKKNVGVDYTATAQLDGNAKENYVIKSNATQLFTITAKEVAITWTNTSLTHNKDQQKPTATINDGEIFAGDVVNVEVSGAKKLPGTYTATATLTGSESTNYVINTTMSSVEFVISNLDIPVDPFTIVKVSDGSVANANNNHWYNYDVKIIPKDGYKIGTANDGDSDFSNELVITDSKQNYKVFLRDSLGRYTGEISIGNTFGNVDGNLNIDKTAPTVSVKLNADNIWETFLNTISFGAYDRFFNTTQTVTITAKDESDTNAAGNSGIESVSYHVSNVGMSFDTVKGLADSAWTLGTSVTFESDNDYVVYTKIVDKAGNVTYASSDGFVYDDTKPKINVSFKNNNATNGQYFKDDRTIVIEITEHNFDPAYVEVDITAEDASGANVDIADYSAFAKDPDNWTHVGDVHTLKDMNLTANANYTFKVTCKDIAGNKNDGINYAPGTVAGDQWFCIDKIKPNVSLKVEGLVEDSEKPWEWSASDADGLTGKVLTSINFNRWSSEGVTVTVETNDSLSDVDYIEYFKTENLVTDITASSIVWSNRIEEKEFNINVVPNEKFILYVHVVDQAGNEIYLSSNGIIVDDKEPGGDNYAPEIDITLPEANKNGIYNEDDTVKVDFKVVEPKYSGANNKVDTGIYSGIKEIKYVIKAEDINAVEEKVFDLSNGSVVDNNGLIGSWTGSITIDKDKFNSNNVVVLITAIDNAGNVHTSTTKVGDIKIDVKAPVIDIEYDNNAADSESFFKDKRTATVTITERNFVDNEDIKVNITNTDGVIPKISAFKMVEGTDDGNGDNTQWEATIVYGADGDYTFAIAYTDLADNVCDTVKYAEGTVAATKFTIDKTIPVVAVIYDNNDVRNGNYYKANRTATITITEHNFDAKRVKILETTPTISAWKSEGDVHTATITYNTDGKYKLDIEFIDMAGNSIADFTAQEFYIDKTNPKVAISGIVDQSANNNDGNIGFSVTATDDNFDGFAPVLSAVVMIDGAFESKNLTIGNTEDITNGQKYTVTNIDTDGIYSITCTVVDKAGNAYSEVILEDANGKTYVEKRSGNDKLVTFSVNRNGSVFTLDSYTDDLVKTYYVKNVTENVTIIEINADPILENTVTLNGKTLVENTDYTVTLNNNAGSWYKYSYSLNKTLFDGESEYNIVVSSKDKATNEAFSDVKDVSVKFVVDRTAPIVTVAGLKTNGRYQVDKQVVTLVPSDDGGSLKSLIVRTVDENGKLIEELINLSGDELLEALANGNITFELGEGLYQNVQIICEDYAGNIIGAETDEIYSNVSISSSAFMIFWANKPLRWGSIAGVILLAAAIVFLVIFKKRKQER